MALSVLGFVPALSIRLPRLPAMDHRLTLSTVNADEKPKIVSTSTRIHSLWSDPSPHASSHIYTRHTYVRTPGPPLFPITPNISPEANPAASPLSISTFAYLHPSPLSHTFPRTSCCRNSYAYPKPTRYLEFLEVCPCFSLYTVRPVR